MVNWDKKFEKSPYDSAGMPLGAETVDYDKKDDVAQSMVKDKYVEPIPLFSDDDEFQEKHITRRQYNEALNNTAIQLPGHKIHEAHKEDIGKGIPELQPDAPIKLDMDDPETHEKLAEEDPKQTNVSKLESDKVEHSEDKKEEDNSNPDDLLKLLKDTDNDGE